MKQVFIFSLILVGTCIQSCSMRSNVKTDVVMSIKRPNNPNSDVTEAIQYKQGKGVAILDYLKQDFGSHTEKIDHEKFGWSEYHWKNIQVPQWSDNPLTIRVNYSTESITVVVYDDEGRVFTADNDPKFNIIKTYFNDLGDKN